MEQSAVDFSLTSHSPSAGLHVLAVTGELDLATTPELRQELTRIIGGGGGRAVVDLSGCDFVDSTALGALLFGAKGLRAGGGDLLLAAPQNHVERALDVTGLKRALRTYRTLREALDAA